MAIVGCGGAVAADGGLADGDFAMGGEAETGGGPGVDAGVRPDGGLAACLGGSAFDAGAIVFVDAGLEVILTALDLHPFTGTGESGVVCGDALCAPGSACCASCASARCTSLDAGSCGPLGSPIACDGAEECTTPAEVCCFTPRGASCTITLPTPDAGLCRLRARSPSPSTLESRCATARATATCRRERSVAARDG